VAAGFPTLAPWVFIEELADGTRIVERNPYYWKVDAAGRQLPYVDRVISRRAETSQAMQTLILGGEADLGGEDNKLAFAYGQMAEESGTHRVHLLAFHINSVLLLQPSNDDPVAGPILKDLRFRQAVARAINYDEMATSVLFKLAGTPKWGYSGTVPATGDPEGAKALLDEMGMDQFDDEGMRLAPGGEKFTFVIETHQATQAWLNPSAELIAAQLREVGIRTDTLLNLDPAIVDQHAAENTMMARIQWMHGPLWTTGIFNDWAGGNWATPWYEWANANVLGNEIPEGAIEPPDDYKRLLEIREEWKVYNFDAPEVPALYNEVMKIHTDNVWIIPLSSDDRVPVLTNVKLGNVCDGCQAIVYDFAMEQLYFEP
jgi:peptide/nickel transport system substrate-binding protein